MAFDLGAAAQIIGVGGNIYGIAKGGQITADTLNKQSELNDRSFAYGVAMTQQQTQATKTIIIYIAIAILMILIVLVFLKRQG